MYTKFFLRKQKGKDESFIYFSVNIKNRGIFKFSTKQKIPNKYWNIDGSFPKSVGATAGIASHIFRNMVAINDFIYEKAKNENCEPTKGELSRFIKLLLNGTETQHNTIGYYLDEYLEDKHLRINNSTRMAKKSCLDHFVNFVGKNMKLTDLNQSKLLKYKDELTKNSKWQLSTVNHYIKNVRAFLRWMDTKENMRINLNGFKKKKEIIKEIINLSQKELIDLENAKFKNNNYQEQVDIFLVGCYTSLVISDLKKIKRGIIDSNNIMTIRQAKSIRDKKIVVDNRVMNILEKYNFNLPFLSDNKGCEILRRAFKELKLDRLVRISVQCSNGNVTDNYKKLHEVITWNTSRKTAISMFFQNGIPLQKIMQITGHTLESTIKRYKAEESKVVDLSMNNVCSN